MVVIAFWLLCRDRPECIPCLFDRKPNGSDCSIDTKAHTNKDPFRAIYFRREGYRFSWYVEHRHKWGFAAKSVHLAMDMRIDRTRKTFNYVQKRGNDNS
ncbi:hypothetical protein [Chamaesiphon sp. OTE_8_metabat_110]|uniref:hypothetical protein n=1 Tax=Chamaesiphon sp. OTE_8_metabat_110 TaxID=2964696 RepID=UPI00286A55DB|nr:hypothetical protein [Chamaesiphon sp. OTE_8_metabat_110]